ncbi:hypothetical protein EGM88_00175 [Aureibaculum marinum]|uniref:Uncharacterized protein n=1 Tax=Aureibaculum marinum TaxID=2487930 RepID=A0A3N4NWQ2_9FLAO|nr:AsmA-like C-terminal region-containing protein [Aureibaculum marinum]RPE00802.1 hypothetical protein EGM88_00175 [Aureibaculum marinum]
MEKVKNNKGVLKKLVIWIIAVLAFITISMLVIPSIFSNFISNEIKKGINNSLETELQFNGSQISFFNHFPSLTFSFENVNLIGSAAFKKDTIISAQELGFGINVFKLIFSDRIVINETYITHCNINLIKDKFGKTNYDIFKASDTTTVKDSSETNLRLNLKHLSIDNAKLRYQDAENGLTINTSGLNYNGRGGLKNGKLKLGSKLDIDSIDVVFENIDYLNGKKLKAKALTVYDTENFAIALDKNTISLNNLNLNFNGKLNVFDDGFAYDLHFNTENGTLEDVVTALPPNYTEWAKEMSLDGDLEATLNLTGYSGTVPKEVATNHITLDANLYDGSIKHKNAPEAVENLFVKLKGDLKENFINLNIDSLNFTLNNDITRGHAYIKGIIDSLYVKSNIKSNINLNILNKTLNLPHLKFTGVLTTDIYTDGMYYPLSEKLPKTKGFFKVTNGSLKTTGHAEPIKNIEIDAIFENKGLTYETSSVIVNTLNFSFLNNSFTSSGSFKNFENPNYQINANGNIDFTSLNQVIELPFLFKRGQLTADLNLKGQLNNPLNKNTNSGILNVTDLEINTDLLQFPVLIKEGKFSFLNEKMVISKLHTKHQSTDVTMNGYFQNYIDYALMSKGILRGDINFKSTKIDIVEFFPKEETQSKDSTAVNSVITGVMQTPKNVDIATKIEIDTLKYNRLIITKLRGNLGLKEQGLFLKNGSLQMVDGFSKLEGFYQPTSLEKALFSIDLKANELNLKKGYNSIDLFKQLAPAAEKASGIVSVDYKLAGILNKNMLPVFPDLKGKGTLKVHSVQFDGYKLMGKISEKSGFNALHDPKISEITIKSSVKNNVLTIDRFKFKIRPFNLRAEGQTTLDGELSIKMRIGLPPLGIIGIPVVVKGNSEDLDIKLGTKSPDLNSLEDIDESYSKEDLLRMSILKDSIREGMSVEEITSIQEKIENIQLDSLNVKSIDSLKMNH